MSADSPAFSGAGAHMLWRGGMRYGLSVFGAQVQGGHRPAQRSAARLCLRRGIRPLRRVDPLHNRPRPGPRRGPARPRGRLRHPLEQHLQARQRHHPRRPRAVPLPPPPRKAPVPVLKQKPRSKDRGFGFVINKPKTAKNTLQSLGAFAIMYRHYARMGGFPAR